MVFGAIVPTFGTEREDPSEIDALVRGYFQLSNFLAKYLEHGPAVTLDCVKSRLASDHP
jgi:hypothetical protein